MMSRTKLVDTGLAERALDVDGYPSLQFIAENHFATRISPDFPLQQQVDWLCEFAIDRPDRDLIAFHLEGHDLVGPVNLQADPRKVMQFLVEHAYAAVLVSIGAELYFYKDATDRYCVYMGSEAVVSKAYKKPPSDADRAFLEWVDDARFIDAERAAVLNAFARYRSLENT